MDTRSPWPDPPWRYPDGAPWMRPRRDGDRRRSSRFTAVLLAAIQVTGGLVASRNGAPIDGLGYALLLIGPAALPLRRRWPVPVYAVALAATLAYLALGYPGGPFFLAALVALGTAIRRGSRGQVWLVTVVGYVLYVLSTMDILVIGTHRTEQPGLGGYLATAAWMAVALILAEANRVRGRVFEEMARSQTESARARREQARRQASDERLRIARELHDVLGHHLSLINVRAGVALHLIDSRPEQAREALGAIKLASAEALREVRTVLSALNPEGEAPPRSPAGGLADVDRLVGDTRDAGFTVHIERSGDVREVPGEVGRAAYRIVREALTNVRRHAGSEASVTVLLGYGVLGYAPAELMVRVDDTGTGAPSTVDGSVPAGNGIPGMRERAVALGGTLTAQGRPGGGFRVEARLPLPDPTTADPTTADPPAPARAASPSADKTEESL